ncbi:MAG: fatty acid desaturase [Planctomycetota bacterium]|nr:fatty acid desaturase [Planctomycetota bacterium]MEE2940084.1 fatty acid desaturase [Planctomycetota bacterium]
MTSLTKAEYPAYQGGQDRALVLTAMLWGLLVGGLFGLDAAMSSGSAWVTAAAAAAVFVLVGWCQASLSNGFHEAVHQNFGSRHSDVLSLLLLGYPTFFTMQYRKVHLQHHLKGGDPTSDPDFVTYGRFPRTRWELVGRLALMASGLAAARQLLTKNLRSGDEASGRVQEKQRAPMRDLAGLALVQLAIASAYLGIFGWPAGLAFYVGFYVLPLGTVAKFIKATRSFCEHGSPDRDYVLRTITGKPWQTGTLGMYGFHYHAEHHLFPWVPYARLGSLHERLAPELVEDAETHQGVYELFEGGYLGLLVHWFRELPWHAAAEAPAST